MKKLKFMLATMVFAMLIWGGSILAQDEGTYIDNASPQDSSYVEEDALSFDDYTEEESSNSMVYIIGAAVIVIGAVVVIVFKKKKKK